MAVWAVFWDRDNTLIADPGYISDPDQVELLPGAAEALRRVSEAGFENIIATNQSGVARGKFDEATLDRIHDRLRALLKEEGATIDAIFTCPYLDGEEAVVEEYRRDSDLRKPKPGMLLKASLERRIDLAASWSVGDQLSDAQAGRSAGCRTIVIARDPTAQSDLRKQRQVDFVVTSPVEAAEVILKHTRRTVPDRDNLSGGDVPAILGEILSFLKMLDRRQRTEDFSLTQLAGVLVQILALGCLMWALFGLISSELLGVQLLRLGYTLVLQLLAITLFVLSSKK